MQISVILKGYPNPAAQFRRFFLAAGVTHSYTYDPASNMTAYTETVDSNTVHITRTFNAANQLQAQYSSFYGNVREFVYDDNGNMTRSHLPDMYAVGENTYAYNQRNLLTHVGYSSPTCIPCYVDYEYDGAGNRVRQLSRATNCGYVPVTTITYTNDIMGLTQVLVVSDGISTTSNLYGHDIILQDDGSQTRTLLTDGLGSVRQETAGSTLEAATTYEPYGNVLVQTGGSNTTYAFTGEQFDGATNLLYLRARYYNPSLKIFMSRDPFPGWVGRPATQHDYAYVGNNPTNRIDPTGKIFENPVIIGAGEINYRDLTSWLYREMMHNINDPRLQSVRKANEMGRDRLVIGTISIGFGCFLPGTGTQIAGLLSYNSAKTQFESLVADRRTWDFKHSIKRLLGEGVTLCSSTGCNNSIEYSVPGNIHFGFVSGEAGYANTITHIGAGVAEITDPAHQNPDAENYSPYNPDGKFGRVSTPWGNSFNFGDDPQDHKAVQFGLYLYRTYGRRLTYVQFLQELGTALSPSFTIFSTHPPSPRPVQRYIAKDWPYSVGYFKPLSK